jgi:hypothetical protein
MGMSVAFLQTVSFIVGLRLDASNVSVAVVSGECSSESRETMHPANRRHSRGAGTDFFKPGLPITCSDQFSRQEKQQMLFRFQIHHECIQGGLAHGPSQIDNQVTDGAIS